MQQIIILKADGTFNEKSVEDPELDYTVLLNHGKVALVPPRHNRENYFKNMPLDIVCYVSNEAGRDLLPISDWTEYLHVTGLMDESFKCIFGDVIVVCETDETYGFFLKMLRDYEIKVNDRNTKFKWTHLKRLMAEYGRLIKCQREACNNKSKNHCGRCQFVMYCSRECQLSDWSQHKFECYSLSTVEDERL